MTDEPIWYPVCPICRQPIYDKHDAYEVQVTYLGWKERRGRWFLCVNCFENTEAGMIFNRATNYIADRRFRPPAYQLRRVLGWYAQDMRRDLWRLLTKGRYMRRSVSSQTAD